MCNDTKDGRKACLAFLFLAVIQLMFIVGALVCGLKGKELGDDEQGSGPGIHYYIGPLVVAGMFFLPALMALTLVIISAFDKDACASGSMTVCMCVINFLGIPVVILGMIFCIAFGIASCKDTTGDEQIAGRAFCSYDTNISENYTIACVALVFILLLLVTDCVSFFVVAKFTESLLSRAESSPSTNRVSSEQVRTTQPASQPQTIHQPQLRPSTNSQQLMTIQQLQEQNRAMQQQIRELQEQHAHNMAPPAYPGPALSSATYPPAYPPPIHPINRPTPSAPPSYESVIGKYK